MLNINKAIVFLFAGLVYAGFFATQPVLAQPYDLNSLLKDGAGAGPVYVVPVEDMIDNGLSQYLDRAIAEAEEADAAVLVFHIDTFGGLVDAADHIRKAILDAEVPTVAFIDKNAASAGALISYANERIVMVPGASIGAATVVEGAGGEAAPDKYQSYMRGLMRATAEANGRDPQIAEAMVDQSIEIDGISEAEKVLTLSAEEALKYGVADRILGSVDELVAELGVADRPVTQHRATQTERILRFFASPVVQSLLMLMMLGGLYFELQSPGVGFAGMMAGIGALLFFAPNYMAGLVESWEVVLFLMGVILLVIEIFVIPGFGIPGISGVILVVGSLLASLVGNVGLSFPEIHQITKALATMAVTLVLFMVLLFSMGRYMPQISRFNRMVLQPELGSVDGYVSSEQHDELIGQTGQALTTLRPSGTAVIEGDRVDVVTSGDFIEAGSAIRVIRVQGNRVEVRKVDSLS